MMFMFAPKLLSRVRLVKVRQGVTELFETDNTYGAVLRPTELHNSTASLEKILLGNVTTVRLVSKLSLLTHIIGMDGRPDAKLG